MSLRCSSLVLAMWLAMPACSDPFVAGGTPDTTAEAGSMDTIDTGEIPEMDPAETGAGDEHATVEEDEGDRAKDDADAAGAIDGTRTSDASTPLPVTKDLTLWLRADLGVTSEALLVSNWADQSGQHLDARQPDRARQPRWVPAAFDGKPAVKFDEDDFLALGPGFADFTLGVSMFVVVATDTTASCADMVHLSNGAEIDDIAFGRHDGKLLYEVLNGVVSGDDFPLGVLHLASVVHSPSTTVTTRLDAAPFATGRVELPVVATRLSNVIGRSLYTDCTSLNGSLSEVLVYQRALDPSERAKVEAYLQGRWGCCR